MRLKAIDTLRGLALISMVLFHTVYDLNYIFGIHWEWFRSDIGVAWQISIGWSFVMIAGLSFNLSRNNLRRAGKLALIAVAISVVTYITKIDIPIWFGVIHCLAATTLLCCVVSPLLKRIEFPVATSLVFILLAILTSPVKDGYINLLGLSAPLPDWLYQTVFLIPFGFPTSTFSSSDYYPLLPYFFVYLSGHELYRDIVRHEGILRALRPAYSDALSFIGRHTLVIYLTHQAVILGVLYLVFAVIS